MDRKTNTEKRKTNAGKKPAPRPIGRPTDYDPAFCQRVIELGAEGYSRAELASALSCSRQTLANWEGEHPDFLDALKRAKDEALAWWEGQARQGIHMGSDFNANLWAKSMNGRFPAEPYRDRVQVTGSNDGPVQTINASMSAKEAAEMYALTLRGGE